MKLSEIKKALKNYGYEIKDDGICTSGEQILTINTIKPKEDWDDYALEIHAEQLEPLANCCGVLEVGGFYIDINFYEDNSKLSASEEQDVIHLAIAYFFLRIVQESTVSARGKIATKKPIIFCSNGLGSCEEFEEAFEKYLTNDFALVSKSKNPNSKNIISVFISK